MIWEKIFDINGVPKDAGYYEKCNASDDLNRSRGVSCALSLEANATIPSKSLNTTDLDFQLFYK